MSTPFNGPVGVGFIGTGVISDQYLTNLTTFPDLEVLILGDLNTEVAAGDSTIASGSGSMSIDGGPKVTLSEASCLTSSTTAAYTATESEGSKSGLLIGKKDGKVSVVVTDGSTVLASEDAAGLQLEPKSAKGSDIAVQGMDGATKKVSFEITC